MRLLTELDEWDADARRKAVKWLRRAAEKGSNVEGLQVKAAELLLTTGIAKDLDLD